MDSDILYRQYYIIPMIHSNAVNLLDFFHYITSLHESVTKLKMIVIRHRRKAQQSIPTGPLKMT